MWHCGSQFSKMRNPVQNTTSRVAAIRLISLTYHGWVLRDVSSTGSPAPTGPLGSLIGHSLPSSVTTYAGQGWDDTAWLITIWTSLSPWSIWNNNIIKTLAKLPNCYCVSLILGYFKRCIENTTGIIEANKELFTTLGLL